MKKLITRLLFLFASLSTLILSVSEQSYADKCQEVLDHPSINIKDQSFADFGQLKLSQTQLFKSIRSTSDKDQKHHKIDPAEVEEDELNTFSKYLTGNRYFTTLINTHASGDLLNSLTGNKYSTLFYCCDKYLAFQVFRI